MSRNNVIWRVHSDHTEGIPVSVSNKNASDFVDVIADGGEVREFKMYDDDGELYYSGKMVCENGEDPLKSSDVFAPLDDYGRPNAGCTELRVNGDKGWETI